MGILINRSIKGPHWGFVYRDIGPSGNYPVVIEFDEDVKAKRPDHLEESCVVVWNFKPEDLNPDRTPSKERVKNADSVEYFFLRRIKTKCKLVAIVTGNGKRKLVFQTNKIEKLHRELEKKSVRYSSFSPEVYRSNRWEYFEQLTDFTQLERQTIDDRKVVLAAVKNGAEMGSVVITEHLILGENPDLDMLSTEIKTMPNARNISISESGLMVQFELPLVAPIISKTTTQLVEISHKHNCVYDGWGTLIKH